MLKSFLHDLQLAIARKDSRAMVYYHLGRIQGFYYASEFSYMDSALAVYNESRFLAHNYAERHGVK